MKHVLPGAHSSLLIGLGFVFLTSVTALAASAPTPVGTTTPATTPTTTTNRLGNDNETEWRFVSNLALQATYDDNISIRPTNEVDDYLFHVAPTFAYGIGNFRTAIAPYAPIPHFIARTGEEDLPRKEYAFASYTPAAVFFRDHDDENAVNHDVRVAGRREREYWNSQGELRFQRVTDADIDYGGRLLQTYYTASAAGERYLTGKIFGGLGVRGYRAEYVGGHASTDYRGSVYFDYQIAPKTRIGVGGNVGYLIAGSGANQNYQQPFVRVIYQPTAKLWFNAQAGEEFRQYDSTIEDRERFVFSVASNYEASDSTVFNLSARRETQSSAQFAGENIVATLYQAGVRQRFLHRIYLSLLGGFARNQYERNEPVAFTDRRDDFTYYRATSSLDITRRGTLELSYEHRENDSTLQNFDFNQNLVSLRASFLF